MTPCECPAAGWCERHQRAKSAHQYQLCQKREDYRALWDRLAIGDVSGTVLVGVGASCCPGESKRLTALGAQFVIDLGR